MKKGLKIGLIIGGSLLIAGGARAGLTKTGVIPNWFEIEALCPNTENFLKNRSVIQSNYESDLHDVFSEKDNSIKDYNLDQNSNNNLDSKIVIEGDGIEKPVIEVDGFNIMPNLDSRDLVMIENEWEVCEKKPIIYIYPTIETKVNVKLGTPQNLSHTYPKYNHVKGWNVIAQPNGELKDTDTGRKLYSLYREGKSDIETNFDEGFVVAGKDIIPFLEEKLAILGLNEREAEEFIVYRLPQMEDNAYNLIRFETKAEQDENMPLNITPKPDTVIRVMMDWKAINEPIDIPEQELVTPKRNGFTVVERGGSPRN